MRIQIIIENIDGKRDKFIFFAKYEKPLQKDYLPLLRMAATMPILNYGLFTKQIKLNYSISKSDYLLIKDLLSTFSIDIFINKLARKKNPYILPEYNLKEEDVIEKNVKPLASLNVEKIVEDTLICNEFDDNSCGILSSSGKESLLTYAMLKEIGANVFPLYINESGGHWKTALQAYRYHEKNEPNTNKVWINVDRFYTFMLDHMKIIRADHRQVWADTYPIRLCIFPVYVFFLLPVFVIEKIGNLLIGSEFDEVRFLSNYKGMRHYFGVYDQTQDYDLRMEKWYQQRMPGIRQWSAVRPVTGLIEERILVSRYFELAQNQRSCHSCHFEGKEIIQCGECSKCLGILLFLKANNIDPTIMGYSKKHSNQFSSLFLKSKLKLDEDEKEHSAFLANKNCPDIKGIEHSHVESIHLHKDTSDLNLIPKRFRKKLLKIIKEYTNGFTILEKDKWIPTNEPAEEI
ncbi:MAG: hypothetical protein GX638_01970 [Crenarchaeota archaeon]|nr:hypothetical protein [Thermoproteota archaeon]